MNSTNHSILECFSDSEQEQIRVLMKTKEKDIKEVCAKIIDSWKNYKYTMKTIKEQQREIKDKALELNILSKLAEIIDDSKVVESSNETTPKIHSSENTFEVQRNNKVVFLSYHETEAHDANTLSKCLADNGYSSNFGNDSNSESLDSMNVKFWIIFMSNSWQSSEECKFQASVAEINDVIDNAVSIFFVPTQYFLHSTHDIPKFVIPIWYKTFDHRLDQKDGYWKRLYSKKCITYRESTKNFEEDVITIIKCLDYEKLVFTSQDCNCRINPLYVDFRMDGMKALHQRQYNEAFESLHTALAISKKLFGERDSKTALIHTNFSSLLLAIGQFDKAMVYAKNALEIFQEVCGLESPPVARCFYTIGDIYQRKDDFNKALETYKKASRISKNFHRSYEVLINTFEKTAIVHGLMHNHGKALKYLQMARKLSEQVLGSPHPKNANLLLQMGAINEHQGLIDESLMNYEEGKSILCQTGEEKYPDLATLLCNIADIHRERGLNDKAITNYEQSLHIHESLGRVNLDSSRVYMGLGLCCRSKELHSEAIKYFTKAKSIREKQLHDTHLDLAETYNHLGMTYFDNGYYDKSIEYLEKARQIYEKEQSQEYYTDSHSTMLARVYETICFAYESKGNYEHSRKYFQLYKDVLDTWQTKGEEKHKT